MIVTLVVAVHTLSLHDALPISTIPLPIAVPAVCAVGVAAVLPVAVPGAATSPGNRICSFVTAPEFTVIAGLVSGLMAGVVMSEAVTVALPAVLRGTLKFLVPPTSAALA